MPGAGVPDMPPLLSAPEDITYPTAPAILIGKEYSFLKKGGKRDPFRKPLPKNAMPPDITEREINFFWRNRKGKLIFTPVYEQYNKLFWDNLKDGTKVKFDFEAFKDTSIYERYLLNSVQFSAAKSAAEGKLIQSAVFDENKVVKGFSQFKKDAEQIAATVNDAWLRTEYDMARRQAVQAEAFDRLKADADILGAWQWRGMMDSRERDEHIDLEGQAFKFGDPDGDSMWPPADWGCRCSGEPVDEDDVEPGKMNSNADAAEWLQSNVDEQFRYNPSTQGMMPKTGSYFSILESANDAAADLFSTDEETILNAGVERMLLKAKGLHYVMETINDWRSKYHVDGHDIIFQNNQTLTNIRFTNNSLHAISKHSKNFEQMPATLENGEIWNHWQDEKQLTSIRHYIKDNYLVITIAGVVTDAMLLSAGAIKAKKIGLPLLF